MAKQRLLGQLFYKVTNLFGLGGGCKVWLQIWRLIQCENIPELAKQHFNKSYRKGQITAAEPALYIIFHISTLFQLATKN